MNKRSPLEVLKCFHEYMELTEGLAREDVRLLLGLGLCGLRFKLETVEEALGVVIPNFCKDVAWRTWNVLLLSGLSGYWELFKEAGERRISLKRALKIVKEREGEEAYNRLVRLLGYSEVKRDSGESPLWTKGGMWFRREWIAKVLILKEHLPARPKPTSFYQKIPDDAILQLEKEIMYHPDFDPDRFLKYEVKRRIFEYSRRRLPELIGTRRRMSLQHCAWLWGTEVIDDRQMKVFNWSQGRIHARRPKKKDLRKLIWLESPQRVADALRRHWPQSVGYSLETIY